MNRYINAFFWCFIVYLFASIPTAVKSEMLMSEKIEELLRKGSCWGCHDTDEIRVGPSYRSISSKYKNANNQQIRILMEKVRYGGAGNWGVVPMVPISQLSSEELNDLVEWILVQQ